MKSFTILEGRGKANVGKVVSIIEVTEKIALVKMGCTNYEICLNGNTLEEKLNRCSEAWADANTTYTQSFDMYKEGANKARVGIVVRDLEINY